MRCDVRNDVLLADDVSSLEMSESHVQIAGGDGTLRLRDFFVERRALDCVHYRRRRDLTLSVRCGSAYGCGITQCKHGEDRLKSGPHGHEEFVQGGQRQLFEPNRHCVYLHWSGRGKHS